MDDVDGTIRSHHSDFGGRKGAIIIGPNVFGGHDVVSAAIGFAGDDRDFGYGSFREGEQKLCAMNDDAAEFLIGSGQEAGYVHEGDQGDVETIAKPDEASGFDGGVDIETSREEHGVIGHHADGSSADPSESHDDIFRVILVNFEQAPIVDHRFDDFFDVVGFVGLDGNHRIEFGDFSFDGIGARQARRVFHVVGRDV